MTEHEKNIRLLRALFLELLETGLSSAESARSVYNNFPHNKTTGWTKNEYDMPVAAFAGPYMFSFENKRIYKELEIKQ